MARRPGRRTGLTSNVLVRLATLGVAAFAVYLLYDVVIRRLNPCDAIQEQAAASLSVKAKTIAAGGELVIGKSQLQELTEKAQVTAIYLKSCCVMFHDAKPAEFLKCKDGYAALEGKLDSLNTQVSAVYDTEGGHAVISDETRRNASLTATAAILAADSVRNVVEGRGSDEPRRDNVHGQSPSAEEDAEAHVEKPGDEGSPRVIATPWPRLVAPPVPAERDQFGNAPDAKAASVDYDASMEACLYRKQRRCVGACKTQFPEDRCVNELCERTPVNMGSWAPECRKEMSPSLADAEGASSSICGVLSQVLQDGASKFRNLRGTLTQTTDDNDKIWLSDVVIPGARECLVYEFADPDIAPSYSCTLAERSELPAVEPRYWETVSKVKDCLKDWDWKEANENGKVYSEQTSEATHGSKHPDLAITLKTSKRSGTASLELEVNAPE